MTTVELSQRIARINSINGFDLAWEWAGQGDEPYISIYEQEERHILTEGPLETIDERLTDNLEAWGLTSD